MSARDPVALLKDAFKLSLYEARAYVAILQGASDPKSISRLGKIPLPRIYDTLVRLESKGFVVRKGDRNMPVEPEIALEGRIQQFEVEHQQDRLAKTNAMKQLLQMLKVQHREEIAGDIAMLRGINSVANKFSQVFTQSRSAVLTVKKAFEARELFLRYITSASRGAKKKIRIIVPVGLKIPDMEFSALSKIGVEIRGYENILLDIMVSDTDDVMIGVPDPLSDEAYHAIAIWTRNSSFAQSLRESLDDLWERSSKF